MIKISLYKTFVISDPNQPGYTVEQEEKEFIPFPDGKRKENGRSYGFSELFKEHGI